MARAFPSLFRWLPVVGLAAACSSPAPSGQVGFEDVLIPTFTNDAGKDTAKDVTATTDAKIDAKLPDAKDIAGTDALVAPDAEPTDVDPGDAPDDSVDAWLEDTAPDPDGTDVEPDSQPDDTAGAETGDVAADTGPACGDGACGAGESCLTCPEDCGKCPDPCGDKVCKAPEDCKTCPLDCGVCPPSCGDGGCTAGENCQTCSADCGKCPDMCGDLVCKLPEDCKTCPKDCGACPPSCGDGKCLGDENCKTCPGDCGLCPGICNPITSDLCKATDQCYTNGKTDPACGPAGKIAKGSICKFLNDCVKGHLCVDGVCSPICDVSGKTPGYTCTAPAFCTELGSGATPLGYNLGACIGGDACNALTNIGCDSGLMCVPIASTKSCVQAGTASLNQPCGAGVDCLPAYICLNDVGGQKCKQRCHSAGGLPKCPNSAACSTLSIGDKQLPAPDNLGACP